MRTLILLGLALLLTTAVDARTHLKKPKRGFQMKVGKYTVAPGQDLQAYLKWAAMCMAAVELAVIAVKMRRASVARRALA